MCCYTMSTTLASPLCLTLGLLALLRTCCTFAGIVWALLTLVRGSLPWLPTPKADVSWMHDLPEEVP